MRNFSLDWYEDLRQERIKFLTKELMSRDQQFYPFSIGNVEEAMGNLPQNEYIIMGVMASIACEKREPIACDLFVVNFKRAITAYWLPYAQDEAERRIPSAAELKEELEQDEY